MGFNTVAVIYNDHIHRLREDGPIGHELATAMTQWNGRRDACLRGYFGAGQIVSMAHADYSQVVVVGRNSGCHVRDAKDLDWSALDQMKECLERHGFKVTKPRRAKPAPGTASQEERNG